AVATRTEAMKPSDLARVVIDTTVQPKAVMFPTDAKLLNRARERLVRLTKKLGVSLRQSYARVGKLALVKHQRYAHAHQFKRARGRGAIEAAHETAPVGQRFQWLVRCRVPLPTRLVQRETKLANRKGAIREPNY